ncbi:MAG: type II secretion system major pseudopilin GspG [Nitrospirae bacterium]|nr:type II secretion system major pseudopilin GspG [Nitrospirota bacterium]
MFPKSDKKGFTFIELLLVIIIIGVLAAMAIPRFAGKSEEAKRAVARADVEANIAIALDLFELDNGRYPTTEEGLAALRTKPSEAVNWNGPYLKKRVPVDPWKHPYIYLSPGIHNPEDYDLYSYGPDGVEGGGDDIVNWEESSSKDK